MSAKGLFYLGAFSIAGLAVGAQGLYTAINNPEAASYTVADYLSQQPKNTWLNLEEAQTDISQAAYFKTRVIGTIDEVYVPIFSAEDTWRGSVKILLETTRPEVIETVKDLEAATEAGEEQFLEYFAENKDSVLIEDDVTGTIVSGLHSDDDTRRELEQLYGSQLSSDFIVIKDGGKPSYLLSILALAAGSAGSGLLVRLLFFRGQKSSPQTQASNAEQAPG